MVQETIHALGELVSFIGTDELSARLKLINGLGRVDIASSMLDCIRGRMVGGVRAPKALLVVSEGAITVMGGVTWSGYMKPDAHVLDMVFDSEEIRAIQIGSSLPAFMSMDVAVPVSRLHFVKERVASITLAHASGKTVTFIPEYEHQLKQCAPVIAGVLDDTPLFRAGAVHFFPDTTESSEAAVLDCRIDAEGKLWPGKLVHGPRYIGFFELGHLTGASTHTPAPRLGDLASLESCVLATSPGNERLEGLVSQFENVDVRHGVEVPASLIGLQFPEDMWLIAPGIRGNSEEGNVSGFEPFLSYCNFLLD